MTFRASRGTIIAVMLMIASAVPVAANAQGFRDWHAGALSLAAPEAWRPPVVDGPDLALLDLSGDDWVAVLTDRPRTPDAGAMLVLRWSNDIRGEGDWPAAFSRTPTMLAAHKALRTDWNDTELGWTGFEIVIGDPGIAKRRFSLTCRGPTRIWSAIQPACERVALSVRLVEASPPIATPPPVSGADSKNAAPSPVSSSPAFTGLENAAPPNTTPASAARPALSPTLIAAVLIAAAAAVAGLALLLIARFRKGRLVTPKLPSPAGITTGRTSAVAVEAEKLRFCTQCGARVATAGPCPKCGSLE